MTTDHEFDRIVAAWLDVMPSRAPDRAVAEVLEDVALTPQVRRPLIWLPQVTPRTSRLLLIAATAVLGLVMIGAAVLLAGGRSTTPIPTPLASPASPSSGATAVPLDSSLRATWTAMVLAIPGLGSANSPGRLVFDDTGSRARVQNIGPAGTFDSAVAQTGDQLRFVLSRDGGLCPAGAEGTYRLAASPDGAWLTLTTISDACAPRADVLGREWVRSLTATTTVGAGLVDAFVPNFSIVMPNDSYEARLLTDYVEIAGANHSIQSWKNPQGFQSACSQAARYAYTPGADAVAAYLAQNDAFTVVEKTTLTISGHHALHVVIRASANYAPCPSQDLMTWTPKDLDGYWMLSPGNLDSVYLVDVGADTVMFELAPVGTAGSEQPIIDSIRIPATLPTQ